ncbi:MAG TPA: DNA-processing protein DprA, partial [Thermoanaerobaculia bacterium]|nr:DNA-processing protein DprA [Thermoanaerobaculia bacterium]
MSHSIRRNLLFAWSILPFLSPAKKRALLARFTPPERILEASAAEIAGALSIRPHEAALVREPLNLPEVAALARAESADAIVLGDPDYPPLLAEIADPPLALFARGDRRLLSLPALAVVGSRRASTYGLAAARRIARELVRGGVAVVSGLARGIDGAAHRETLEAGGATLAVLGTGVDLAYPPEHRTLRDRILECGLVLSELPPGTPPRREHFPVRNRIIAGLAHGVVVVEAGAKSGSLITARLALEGGREVFAVPGSIFSQTSEGGHRLIQDGAKLLHSMDDLWNELP